MSHRISYLAIIVIYSIAFSGISVARAAALLPVFALPYAAGQSFVVTQGYETPPTHIKKDEFAIDFTQNGCNAYDKPVVATADGTVMLAADDGYNGGYGTEVLIDHGNNIVSRYAHMISGSIAVAEGGAVMRGTILGAIGDTGLVAGNACDEHPGTHVHFAVYEKMPDGSYFAVKPEPLSGYQSITEGQWYLAPNVVADVTNSATSSDNGGDVAVLTEDPAVIVSSNETPNSGVGVVLGAETSSINSGADGGAVSNIAANVVLPPSVSAQPPSASTAPAGGVSVVSSGGGGNNPIALANEPATTSQAEASSSDSSISNVSSSSDAGSPGASSTDITSSSTASSTASQTITLPPPTPANGSSSFAVFDTSTLAIDLSWLAPTGASGTVTYSIFDLGTSSGAMFNTSSLPIWTGTSTNFSYQAPPDGSTHEIAITATNTTGSSSTATTRVVLPNWMTVVQADDSTVSYPSWYDDTWNQLGTGFYGTIRSLTLNGYVDNPDYYASHLSLDEFLDPTYTTLNQSFNISDDAPFTATSTFVTMKNLNIELQPNKYYRLDTYNDYQNRSIILHGTSATGTAMSDGYIYGVGRVESHYPFYPYLAWTFIPQWPLLAAPNTPPDFMASFDPTNVALGLSWATTTDPDTTSTLLTYEYAVATSTSLDGATWQTVGKNLTTQVPVIYPNSYTVGVRARDDLNNVSAPATISWNFPAGYAPLPSQVNHDFIVSGAPEKFHLYATTTITSIDLWTQFPGSNIYRAGYDAVEIHADANGAPGDLLATSNMESAGGWGFEVPHDLPQPLTLSSGDYWLVQGPQQFAGSSYYGDVNGNMYFRLMTLAP